MPTTAERIARLEPAALAEQLLTAGHARVPGMLDPERCATVRDLYVRNEGFRKQIDLNRHGYGIGEYRYFARPLPAIVDELREQLYVKLAPVANDMMERLGRSTRYPAQLAKLSERCREHGQTEPTPLVLHYGPGGENRLHRDLYGPLAFPLQALILLSRPGVDFEGGEFLLLEQRARQQSRAEALTLQQGELVIFPGYERVGQGRRKTVVVGVRHGVSRVRSGQRYTLGIIFHDSVG